MTLLPADRVWGGAEVRPGPPRVERLRDVVYTPYHFDLAWGVFDHDGRIVEPTVDRRYPQGEPIAQVPEITAAELASAVPAPPGEYIYVGRFSTHFGHFLVETLPRYWSLTRGVGPRQKLLIHEVRAYNFFEGFPFAQDIFRALGLRREHFFFAVEPTRIAELTVPHASLRQQAWAHPAYGRLCRHIGRRLLAGRRATRRGRPVWLSKSRLGEGVARFLDEDRLEAALSAAGVEIVHPETLPLAEQLALFEEREAVLGMTGSAFHLAAFASAPTRLIGLGCDATVNSNLVLFDRIGRLDMQRVYAPGTIAARPIHGRFLVEATLPDPEQVARDLLALI